MIFEFVDSEGTKEIEIDDSLVSTSYIDLELLEEENDEDKAERQKESD